MLRIELDEVKKWRNKSEFQRVPRARHGNLAITGYGKIVAKICAELSEIYDGTEMVEVWRGDMLCFQPQTLERWIRM